MTYMRYLLQSSDAPENCLFVRWVDPPPLHPHQEYIYYLQDRIFDLEMEVSSGDKDEEEDDNNNSASSQEVSCTDSYCNCPCHRNKGPRHHRHRCMQWEDTMEKGQHNLLYGDNTMGNLSYSHVTSMCLLFRLITLRHVRFSRESLYLYFIQVLTCHFMCCACSII
jgi:hypothetical protein